MGLALTRRGGRGRVTLVLHGFTGSADAMAPVVEGLAQRRRVVAPDLIGHGASPAPREIADYLSKEQVAQLQRVIDEVGAGDGDVDVVGYSMGARLALCLAADQPGLVRRLVLIGGTAGLADEAQRSERAATDAQLADRIEREGVEPFVDYWESIPLFASQQHLPDAVRDGIRAGRVAQRPWGLANSLRGFSTGVMPSLWHLLPTLCAPTLVLAGSLDQKYVALAADLTSVLPNAARILVPDVGHAAHVEAPQVVCDAIVGHTE